MMLAAAAAAMAVVAVVPGAASPPHASPQEADLCPADLCPPSMNAHPQVRIDHRNGTLHFGSQALESERIRDHLAQLAQRLSKVRFGPTGGIPSWCGRAVRGCSAEKGVGREVLRWKMTGRTVLRCEFEEGRLARWWEGSGRRGALAKGMHSHTRRTHCLLPRRP